MKALLTLLVLSLVLRVVLSVFIYSGDVNNHIGWAKSILHFGFSGAYDRDYVGIMQPTYPPLSLFAFTTSTGLYDLTYSLSTSLNHSISSFPSKFIWALEDQDVLPAFTKVITIIADLGIGVLLYLFTRNFFPSRRALALVAAGAYLLNPAVWYTSSLWGQIESLPLFFLLLSYWYAFRYRPLFAHAAFVAALLTKQSAIIMIPIFLLISFTRFGLATTLRGLLLQLMLFYSAFSLFFSSLNPLWPIQVYINRLQTGSGSNWITDHAFNPWYWLTGGAKIPDTTIVFAGQSAQLIGFGLFIIALALVFISLTRRHTWPRIFAATSLFPMLAFLLLTKMHERYYAPVLPFLALSATTTPWLWLVYTAVSIAHLANLHHNWWYPRVPTIVDWLSSPQSISLIISIFLVSAVATAYAYAKD